MTAIFELPVINDGVTGTARQADARVTWLSHCHNRHDTFACSQLPTTKGERGRSRNISRRK